MLTALQNQNLKNNSLDLERNLYMSSTLARLRYRSAALFASCRHRRRSVAEWLCVCLLQLA